MSDRLVLHMCTCNITYRSMVEKRRDKWTKQVWWRNKGKAAPHSDPLYNCSSETGEKKNKKL